MPGEGVQLPGDQLPGEGVQLPEDQLPGDELLPYLVAEACMGAREG